MATHKIESEVDGNVWKVIAEVGAEVQAGEVLIILESMKMEIPVESPVAGVVRELRVQPNDQVEEEQVLAVVEG